MDNKIISLDIDISPIVDTLNAAAQAAERLRDALIEVNKLTAPLTANNIKTPVKSVCVKCGNEFEQGYIPEQNRFTVFKTCYECRHTGK